MTPRNSPTVWRRWLAAELKGLREAKGLHQKDVGRECGWSGARLSYLEHGQQVPTEDDLDQLLPLYGVAGDEVSPFYEAVKFAREKGWWERYDDRIVPPYVAHYIGLEQGASMIRTVEPLIVPGLLQTRDYIVANLRNDITPRTEHHIAQIADVRIARQDALTSDPPLELRAVIDESVLLRMVGRPDVMAAQLEQIAAMAERPNVEVRVFPFEKGVNQGMAGPYRILSFGPQEPSVLYIEHRDGGNYHEEAVKLDEHILAFDHLLGSTWSSAESISYIMETARKYANRPTG
ncbi:MAG TPA: helix-turn-helix transcriptional regulator [Acidimicrobiales bacterium]|nr:helix-turn-helix transcriptional regulator [Acidimicrobiales bacterium]